MPSQTPKPAPLVAQVAVPLPVTKAYTYSIPEALAEEVQVGMRVLVPFGPRRLTGLVVDLPDVPATSARLKPILDVLDEAPAFTDEMLRLTKWMADYYVCGWGEVIRAALPSGTDVESRRRVVRTEVSADPASLSDAARRVLRYLEQHQEATVSTLRQQAKGTTLALLRRLEEDGLVTLATELREARVQVKYEKHLRFAPAFRHRGAAAELREQLRGHKQVAIVEALAGLALEGVREPRQADVLARAEAAAATVRTLMARGIVEVVEKEVIRSPLGDLQMPEGPPPRHALHPAQEQALARITEAVDARRFESFLLHGVTGSGKTEVYIAALKQVIAQGRTGIILVPEIALTPQTVRRFHAHFGDRVAVLHSRMSLGERYDAWRHLRSGRFSIAIGPRSAILAPLSNIGLIVVDEEHEHSYKQFDPAPRYHARDVAVMRAHLSGAVCVLGSATPSMESFVNAQWGKYTLLEMPERVPVLGRRAAPLPDVAVVDLTLEKKKHRLDGALSVTLQEAIQARLDRKEQVILLQNRRGYAPVIECNDCGWVPTCHDCSVSLTYHKPRRQLRCHYCGRAERIPRACPECGSQDTALLGSGTQRVEEELEARFPTARILRMDLDTTSRKNAHHELLDRFGRGDADILLGTQMVAKGLDFGRVTLVGVIDADTGMLLPDFRSEERTFQLLTQVAGRAGRADLPGEVLLQTRNPDHAAIRHALAHDYHGFVEAVLPDRHMFGYPPFGRLAGVEFRGPQEAQVEAVARQWTAGLRRHAPPCVQILGPEAPFVGRVKKQFRYHTIIKAPRGTGAPDLQALLRQADDAYGKPPKNYHVSLDVDPLGLF